eukprot:Blabericola_migrator_1__9067@NODE_482_length_8135_cov_36_394398_g375_i0_p2_GENE_NODE_482_length_8135_cov_36_394398_g375_i0NODE_482_length_8135_cov_36_394398_g375_i0_p2_ORF_typecomplete_len967_score150_89_NODE_482_length_8135_cov_36_394398_g375_i011234023
MLSSISESGSQQVLPSKSGLESQQVLPTQFEFESVSQQMLSSISESGPQQVLPSKSGSELQQVLPSQSESVSRQVLPYKSESRPQQVSSLNPVSMLRQVLFLDSELGPHPLLCSKSDLEPRQVLSSKSLSVPLMSFCKDKSRLQQMGFSESESVSQQVLSPKSKSNPEQVLPFELGPDHRYLGEASSSKAKCSNSAVAQVAVQPEASKRHDSKQKAVVKNVVRNGLLYLARCLQADRFGDAGRGSTSLSQVAAVLSFRNLPFERLLLAGLYIEAQKHNLFNLLTCYTSEMTTALNRHKLHPGEQEKIKDTLTRFLTSEHKYRVIALIKGRHSYRRWMCHFMTHLAQLPQLSPQAIMDFMVEEFIKRQKFRAQMSMEMRVKQDDGWLGDIADLPNIDMKQVVQGAAKFMTFLAGHPLEIASSSTLAVCEEFVQHCGLDPVKVLEDVWHSIAHNSKKVLCPDESPQSVPAYWLAFSGHDVEAGTEYAVWKVEKRKTFWSRVSYLFLHNHEKTAKDVQEWLDLPPEQRKKEWIDAVVIALSQSVSTAHRQMLETDQDSNLSIAPAADLLPAVTLLRLHDVILPLNPHSCFSELTEVELLKEVDLILAQAEVDLRHRRERQAIIEELRALLHYAASCAATATIHLEPWWSRGPEGKSHCEKFWRHCILGAPIKSKHFSALRLLLPLWKKIRPLLTSRYSWEVVKKVETSLFLLLRKDDVGTQFNIDRRRAIAGQLLKTASGLASATPAEALLCIANTLASASIDQNATSTVDCDMSIFSQGAFKLFTCLASIPLDDMDDAILAECHQDLLDLANLPQLFSSMWRDLMLTMAYRQRNRSFQFVRGLSRADPQVMKLFWEQVSHVFLVENHGAAETVTRLLRPSDCTDANTWTLVKRAVDCFCSVVRQVAKKILQHARNKARVTKDDLEVSESLPTRSVTHLLPLFTLLQMHKNKIKTFVSWPRAKLLAWTT